VRFSIFLCFFLRIRLRRFLMSDPMAASDASRGVGNAPNVRYNGGVRRG
jgi:hypothetical protein